jgi:hypothetical protein
MDGREHDTNGSELVDWHDGDRIWLGLALIILSGCVAGALAFAVVKLILWLGWWG